MDAINKNKSGKDEGKVKTTISREEVTRILSKSNQIVKKNEGTVDINKEEWKSSFLQNNHPINDLRERIYPHLRAIQFVNLYRPGNNEVFLLINRNVNFHFLFQ